MFWKIMDVKIWFDCISYASWLCEERIVWNRNKNEKTLKKAKMKRKDKWEMEIPQKGQINKGMRSLWWKIQKFIPEKL